MRVGEDLLFFGGMGTCLQSTIYAYSIVTHKWRVVPLSPIVPVVARSHHTTVYDPLTGAMLLVGGQDALNRPLLSAATIAIKSTGF